MRLVPEAATVRRASRRTLLDPPRDLPRLPNRRTVARTRNPLSRSPTRHATTVARPPLPAASAGLPQLAPRAAVERLQPKLVHRLSLSTRCCQSRTQTCAHGNVRPALSPRRVSTP